MTKAWLLGEIALSVPFPITLARIAVLKNYNPDPQLLSKYVIRANVTATKFVCLGKKQATCYLGLTNFVR